MIIRLTIDIDTEAVLNVERLFQIQCLLYETCTKLENALSPDRFISCKMKVDGQRWHNDQI